MTLLGKVFTGLIFLLSVVFFCLSVAVNARHINQTELAASLKTQVGDLQREMEQVRGKNEELKTDLAIEQAARRSALSAINEQLTSAQSDREASERALRDLQSSLTAADQSNSAALNELEAKTNENDLLRKQLVDARLDRDQTFQRLLAATDENNRLKGDLQTLNLHTTKIADNLTKAKEKLDALGIDEDTLLGPPSVNGEVLAVSTDGSVEVSLGRDDGMRSGFTLEVSRGSQYLGRLMVKTVADDKSIAKIVDGYQRGYIRAGDRVDSKLF